MVLFLAAFVLPLAATVLLARRARRPAGGWIATLVLSAGLTAFSLFVVPWAYFGMSIRYAIAAAFVVALLVSLRRPSGETAEDTPARMLLKVLIGLFFGSVALGVLRANSVPPGVRDLAFPLAKGSYAVVHGGSTTAANTHYGRGAQGWAVDVMKAGGSIANETVVSPCDGAVVSTRPLRVRCGDITVELTPAEGQSVGPVRRGAPVGRVTGDSLHVFAQRGSDAVPVTFDGRWLVRNAVVRK